MCTAHYILFKALSSMINNCLCACTEENGTLWPLCNTRRNARGAGLAVCAVDHMLPQSHTLLFSLILSATSLSMTVFVALKWTLFYDRLELWFDWWSMGQIWLSASEGGVVGWWQAVWWVKTLPRPSNESKIYPPLSNEPHLYTALNTREKL